MKKIAFVIDDMTLGRGIQRVITNIANELAEDYEIYIYSLMNIHGKVPFELNEKIKCVFLSENEEYRLKDLILKFSLKIRKLLKHHKIDCVLNCGIFAGTVGTISAFGYKCKSIYCEHGALTNQLDNKKAIYARKIIACLSNYIVVLTDQTMNDYINILNVSKNKIFKIYNLIDENMFKYVQEYDKKSKKIMSVGRISSEKGFDLLIDVAIKLKKLNNDWQWEVYGDGPEFDNIKQKIKDNDLEEYVLLKGHSDFIYDKYANHAMFVLTSYREGFSLVLLEARVNKLPVLSFDIISGPSEIIKNNENGFLIKPFDTESMAKKINYLLINDELRNKFSQKSYEKIEKFKKDYIIKQWKELIRINI